MSVCLSVCMHARACVYVGSLGVYLCLAYCPPFLIMSPLVGPTHRQWACPFSLSFVTRCVGAAMKELGSPRVEGELMLSALSALNVISID